MARMERVAADRMRSTTAILAVIPLIDGALWNCGASYEPYAKRDGHDWSSELLLCLDRVIQVTRLLLSAQYVGAAVMVRLQLDRMTLNRSATYGRARRDGELYTDWLSRVWHDAGKDPPDAANLWKSLSEMVHGSGPISVACAWEAAGFEPATPKLLTEIERVIVETQRLVLRQLRGAVGTLAQSQGFDSFAHAMQSAPEVGSATGTRPLSPLLWPMTYDYVDSPIGEAVSRQATLYWGTMRRLKSTNDDEFKVLPALSFAERRSRVALRTADLKAVEEEQLGDQIDVARTSSRLYPFILSAEASAIASRWAHTPAKSDFAVASSALRSSVWLWLEDEMVAMATLRTVLECTARIRSYRLKPKKSAELSASGSAVKPVRWIELAGLRRLTILNSSLGELSHFMTTSRWEGAFEALCQLQALDPGSAEDLRRFTARGHALDVASNLLLDESIAALDQLSPDLGRALGRIASTLRGDDYEVETERLLGRGLTLKSFDFGSEHTYRTATRREVVEVFGEDTARMLEELAGKA
jgi:hypothetical protein